MRKLQHLPGVVPMTPRIIILTSLVVLLTLSCDEDAIDVKGADTGVTDTSPDVKQTEDLGEDSVGSDAADSSADVGNDVKTEEPELKAFPSALGDGAYATGGRGGIVVHVTNLNDRGPGSFREAAGMTVPRIIVFDVSGVITLESVLGLGEGNVTIAGQTAPEGGITIDGDRLYVNNAKNVIVRHMRFKGGRTIANDAVTVTGDILDQIWDHCSFGFGTDEGASWYTATTAGKDQNRITVQRCLWNENSKGSILGKGADLGGTPPTGSFIANMFYNSGYRFPNVSSSGVGQFDIINNVSWNVTSRLIRGNGPFKMNHIGNHYDFGTRGVTDTRTHVYRFGPTPQLYNSNNKIVGIDSNPLSHSIDDMNANSDLSWGYFQDGDEVQAGNWVVGEDYTIPAAEDWGTTDYTQSGAASNTEGLLFVATNTGSGTGFAYDQYYGERLPSEYFSDTQHELLGPTFTPMAVEESLTDVVGNVGCNARLNADGSVSENLDTFDANALSQATQGNYVSRLERADYVVPPITPLTRANLNTETGASDYDTDADGMPDVWEIAMGFNPNLADDSGDADGDGYTNIEEFLNSVDE